jgi:hypothetical protein
MRLRPALLITGFAVLIVLPGSAAGGGRGAMAVPGSVGGQVVISRHPAQRHSFKPARLGGAFLSPYVRDTVVIPVPVAVPVPVTAAAPSTAEAAAPPPPEEPSHRPAVVNPGPKIIDISPPAPGAKTVTITVHQGSSTVVETVPVR